VRSALNGLPTLSSFNVRCWPSSPARALSMACWTLWRGRVGGLRRPPQRVPARTARTHPRTTAGTPSAARS